MPSGGANKFWTDELIESELRAVAESLGHFPSVSELRSLGQNRLTCIASKRGGMLAWSERLGLPRRHSDSDTGWDGEIAFASLCKVRGMKAERMAGVKAPFDILLDDVIRVDVKTAKFAEYGPCRGWFYRLGKIIQADLVVFYQLDTGSFYSMPWWGCPRTNVTISRGGGKYAGYHNNWDLITEMIEQRGRERRNLVLLDLAS